MTLSKKQRAELFNMFGGKCAYCGCELPEKGWHADHIEAVMRETKWQRNPKTGMGEMVATGKLYCPENDRCDNFFPSCRSCNINKSCCSIELWRSCLERSIDGMRRDHASFRHAERFGLVAQVETKVVFHFERIALLNATQDSTCEADSDE